MDLEGSQQLRGEHVVSLDSVQGRGVRVVGDTLCGHWRCQQPQLLPLA